MLIRASKQKQLPVSVKRSVSAKRFDAFILNDVEGLFDIKKFDYYEKVEMAEYKHRLKNNGFFAFSQKSKFIDKAPVFEKILADMIKTGELDKIVKSYLKK